MIDNLVFLLELLKRNMLVPGRIEKWIIFLDVKNLSLYSIPFKVILNKQILQE